ncbi:MAG: phosphatase PAP2 family protein [Saprospiraceae bacterium]|nr:phosphatase PAP2 family protein [Saprospiraceae bacterium]
MKTIFKFGFSLLLMGSGLFFIQSCTKDNSKEGQLEFSDTKEFDASVPLAWNELITEIDRFSTGYRPPAAARMFGYVGLAAYEAVVPGMPEYQSLESQFSGLKLPKIQTGAAYHWPTVANAAYANILRQFYSQIKVADFERINTLESKFNLKNESILEKEELERSKLFGKDIATAVFNFSVTDAAGHEAYKNPTPNSYIPPKVGPNGEKLWQPTLPDYSPALFPYWGQVRPFAMKTSDLRAKPPIPYSENPGSKFYLQALETKAYVDNLNFEDQWISQFWSDDFFEVTFEPAARQLVIANQLVQHEKLSLDRAVELYAKLGMAMADAAISIWYSKYTYNVRRPVEYIQELIDPTWKTQMNHPYTNMKGMSPNFPAYPSGHSGFGSSGAAILTDILGSNKSFTDNSHKDRFEFLGAPRSFSSFSVAGLENAYSRITLGVHYRMDCDEGVRLGNLAAKRVIELEWKK